MIATFGAGCFWGVQAAFSKIKSATSKVGFMGGILPNPSYEDVCYKDTKHAEVVQIIYDSKITSYEELLDIFWSCHDPTTINRQGPDIGDQYRSVIFYHDEKQKKLALASREEQNKKLNNKIVTQILPASDFYAAEEYHQNYFEKNGKSCHF